MVLIVNIKYFLANISDDSVTAIFDGVVYHYSTVSRLLYGGIKNYCESISMVPVWVENSWTFNALRFMAQELYNKDGNSRSYLYADGMKPRKINFFNCFFNLTILT